MDSANLRAEIQEDDMTLNNHVAMDERNKTTPLGPSGEARTASPVQVVKYLFSDTELGLCGTNNMDYTQKDSRAAPVYPQLLSPFEELLAAVILSRSGSYQLGLQTIRTVLSPPYAFRNSAAIKSAGRQKVIKAIAQAQKKEKSAEDIEFLAEAISNNNWHTDLIKLRRQARGGAESEREVLRRGIKGLGKNGLDIFYRRIQWFWKEAYPFVDSRTQVSIEKLGLPARPDSLVRLIDLRWDELRLKDLQNYSTDESKRRAFVLLLEQAVSADLDMRIDEVLEGASRV